MLERPSILLADANVLIDFRDADQTILSLAAEHIGPIYVLHVVLEEVKDFDEKRAQSLGLVVVDVPTELMLEVDLLPHRLRRADRLCFLACRDNDWICLTNDRLLRTHCEGRSIRTRWGLELLLELQTRGVLTRARAIEIAESIAAGNRSIAAVLDRFRESLS